MKKLLKVLMIVAICLGISACGDSKAGPAESIDDVDKIVKENDFKDEGIDDIGLFWKFSFAGMGISVGFNIDDTPRYHYFDNQLKLGEISYIEIKPDKDIGSQWIYLRSIDDEFKVDEQDIEKYNDKGRKEAYSAYQEKFEELGLNPKLFASWAVKQFNENTRVDLDKAVKADIKKTKETLDANGYTYEVDSKGRRTITANGPYKIVIVNKQCMVMDSGFDLDVKTGYMYLPAQGTCGYSVNGNTLAIYSYTDNVAIQGKLTLEQYARMQELQQWYIDFRTGLNIKEDVLRILR